METKSIINENVVNLIVRLRELEGDFTKELNDLEKRSEGIVYDDISEKFWNSYSDMMEAFIGLLGETALINANDD